MVRGETAVWPSRQLAPQAVSSSRCLRWVGPWCSRSCEAEAVGGSASSTPHAVASRFMKEDVEVAQSILLFRRFSRTCFNFVRLFSSELLCFLSLLVFPAVQLFFELLMSCSYCSIPNRHQVNFTLLFTFFSFGLFFLIFFFLCVFFG